MSRTRGYRERHPRRAASATLAAASLARSAKASAKAVIKAKKARKPLPAAPLVPAKVVKTKKPVVAGAVRKVPCGACVRSSLAGQKRGACLEQASARAKRCFHCAKHNHSCVPVSSLVDRAFTEFLALKRAKASRTVSQP
jgi:hypothetical protein